MATGYVTGRFVASLIRQSERADVPARGSVSFTRLPNHFADPTRDDGGAMVGVPTNTVQLVNGNIPMTDLEVGIYRADFNLVNSRLRSYDFEVTEEYTQSAPLRLERAMGITLDRQFRGVVTEETRSRAEQAAGLAEGAAGRAEGEYYKLADLFLGGTEAVNDAAVATYVGTNGTATRGTVNDAINGIFNDDAVAEYVGAEGTSTGQALNDKFATAIKVTPQNISSLGFSQAFNNIASVCPNGSTLLIPPGDHIVTDTLSNYGKSLSVIAYGARFIQGFNGLLGLFQGEWGAIWPVSGIYESNIIVNGAVTKPVSVLSIDSAHGYQPGDIIKVFSNAYIDEARTPVNGVGSRHGEFATVSSVSGSSVALSGYLKENHSGNIRVSRLSKAKVNWEGGTYRGSDESFTQEWTGNVMLFRGLSHPSVANFAIERASSTGLTFSSCYVPIIQDYHTPFLENKPQAGQVGYSVLDLACEGLIWTNSSAGSVRHAYTDDTPRISANDNRPWVYGRSYNATCFNVHVRGGGSSAFCPHHAGSGHMFVSCTVLDNSSGFAMRGRNHTIQDCVTRDVRRAVSNVTEGGGKTYGTRVINHTSEDVDQAHIVEYNQRDSYDGVSMEIIGGTFKGRSEGFIINSAGNIRVTGNPLWVAPPTLPDDNSAIRVVSGAMEIESAELDYRQNTSGTGLRAATQEGAPPMSVTGEALRVRNAELGARMGNIFMSGPGGNGNAVWAINRVIFDAPPQSYLPMSGHNLELSRFYWETPNRKFSSAYNTRHESALSQDITFPNRTPVPIFHMRVEGTTNNRTVGTIAPGAFNGQILVITWVATNPAMRMTVPNDPGRNILTPGEQSILVDSGGSIMLIWDNTAWRPIS